MHLDIRAHRLKQAGDEQIDLLFFADVFAAGQQCEELVDVLVDGSRAAAMRELAEGVAPEGGPNRLWTLSTKAFQSGTP